MAYRLVPRTGTEEEKEQRDVGEGFREKRHRSKTRPYLRYYGPHPAFTKPLDLFSLIDDVGILLISRDPLCSFFLILIYPSACVGLFLDQESEDFVVAQMARDGSKDLEEERRVSGMVIRNGSRFEWMDFVDLPPCSLPRSGQRDLPLRSSVMRLGTSDSVKAIRSNPQPKIRKLEVWHHRP